MKGGVLVLACWPGVGWTGSAILPTNNPPRITRLQLRTRTRFDGGLVPQQGRLHRRNHITRGHCRQL